MEDNQQKLSVEAYFSALHQLRNAAREVLQKNDEVKAFLQKNDEVRKLLQGNDEERKRLRGNKEAMELLQGFNVARKFLLGEMDKLTGSVEFEGAETFLKEVFKNVTKQSVKQLAEVPAEKLAGLKVPAKTELPVEKFVEIQKEIIAKKKEYATLCAGGGGKKGRALKEKEDSLEVQALKAEISGWIEKELPTDKERKAAKNQLNEAEAIYVRYDKKTSRIMANFGDFTAEFKVSTSDIKRINIGLSTYGGLAQILEPAKAYRFTDRLVKHQAKEGFPNGVRYVTGIGEKAANLKKQQKNKEKSQQDKLQKLEKEIALLHNKLQMSWRYMLQNASGAAIYKDLRNPKGLLRSAGDNSQVETDKQLVSGILDADNLWTFYHKKNDSNDGFHKAKSEYTKLENASFEGWKMQNMLAEAYKTYQVSGDKSIPFFGAQLKRVRKRNAEFAEIPFEAVEQHLLDEAFKFAMPSLSGQSMDDGKFKFMNKLMERFGLRIRLDTHTVTKKCDGKLNDKIHAEHGKVKQYKKQLTGLLYFMGKKRAAHKSTSDLLYDTELSEAFKAVCKLGDISGDWQLFINNLDNLDKAKDTYNILNAEYGEKAAEIASTLFRGGEVTGNSLHHITYAYYASLMGSGEEDLVAEFNSPTNTVEVLPPAHPAFEDVHRDLEHRFNVSNGASVLVKRGDEIMLCTTNTCKVGDVLQMPVLERKGKDGKFSELMHTDTVFITAKGQTVSEPVFGGEGKSRARFITEINKGVYRV